MTPQQEANGPLDELISAENHKRELKAALKEVEKTINDIKEVVLAKFQQEGTRSVRRDDGTVYLQKKFTVKPRISKDHVIEALVASGFDDLVVPSYNYMRLCSLIKEMDDNNDPLPPELIEAVEAKENYTVVVRKS